MRSLSPFLRSMAFIEEGHRGNGWDPGSDSSSSSKGYQHSKGRRNGANRSKQEGRFGKPHRDKASQFAQGSGGIPSPAAWHQSSAATKQAQLLKALTPYGTSSRAVDSPCHLPYPSPAFIPDQHPPLSNFPHSGSPHPYSHSSPYHPSMRMSMQRAPSLHYAPNHPQRAMSPCGPSPRLQQHPSYPQQHQHAPSQYLPYNLPPPHPRGPSGAYAMFSPHLTSGFARPPTRYPPYSAQPEPLSIHNPVFEMGRNHAGQQQAARRVRESGYASVCMPNQGRRERSQQQLGIQHVPSKRHQKKGTKQERGHQKRYLYDSDEY